MAIKYAKYFELTKDDIVLTVFTDSMELYQSRLVEMREKHGTYTKDDALRTFHLNLEGQKADNLIELNYLQRKRIHHLKYYTWIEQQGRDVDELDAQWYDPDYWKTIQNSVEPIDELIIAFNEKVKNIQD
ncbi:MAG: hypothetical protein GOP50_05505 [Candidatus Heimdallarchaeota archaeon]|nr:hypothetical protein [Candidatus Heimdallarchaeota archaeon]